MQDGVWHVEPCGEGEIWTQTRRGRRQPYGCRMDGQRVCLGRGGLKCRRTSKEVEVVRAGGRNCEEAGDAVSHRDALVFHSG